MQAHIPPNCLKAAGVEDSAAHARRHPHPGLRPLYHRAAGELHAAKGTILLTGSLQDAVNLWHFQLDALAVCQGGAALKTRVAHWGDAWTPLPTAPSLIALFGLQFEFLIAKFAPVDFQLLVARMAMLRGLCI